MAFFEEAIISGFIGEAASRCVDVSCAKIKEAVKNRKNKHKNIESQIYNVIVNVLNQITCNKFENDQDKIYQTAEKLLMGYKDDRCDSIEAVKSGLQILDESVNNDKYMEFKTLLYQEISKSDYEELYRQIRLFQQDEESSKTIRIEHSVDEVKQDVREIKRVVLNEKKENEENFSTIHNVKFQNDKKQDYIKNWNSRLFLHTDNEENPITLADAFIMPSCRILKSNRYIKCLDDDALDEIIDKFVKYNKSSTMLITGVPGIGKSSITSWIANKYRQDDNCIILRFRDWDSEELEKGILKSIYNTLECKKRDLENKVVILDGYDEMKSLNIQKKLLVTFFSDIKDFENFKCIITSRPAYINSDKFENILILKEFDIIRVENFCRKITGKGLENKKKIKTNLEVLGIPVILYMALMSNIDITENPTKPELYNHIFAEEGGIFDKFYDGQVEYSKGNQIMRISPNIKKYLEFLRETAFMMFQNGRLSLLINECNIPDLEFEEKSVSILEFPIKHLFENTSSNIEFIHKSIYEYFVSEYIFSMFEMKESKEKLASTFGCLLKSNILSAEILEFLRYKIRNKANDKFDIVYETFQLMLQDGMTYHTGKCYKNIIDREMTVFANMLEIIHLWEKESLVFNNLIFNYINYNVKFVLNLSKINFSGKNLTGMNLSNVDLSCAELNGANLTGVNLEGANLIGANLTGVNLEGANLKNVVFSRNHIQCLEREYNLKGAKVYSDENNTVLDYW